MNLQQALPELAAEGRASSPEGTASYRLALTAIVLLAFALRIWDFRLLGLTHYDEGVYTLSGLWSLGGTQQGSLFPWQKFFSPPGYFLLIGAAFRLLGRASDLAAIAINVVFGTATVWLVAWVGRKWFGPAASLFSAGLIALSQFHMVYSRTALTDTSFGFCFVLALALVAISIECERPLYAVLAGLAVGAAWNMKYHGWLVLPVSAFVIAVETLRHPGDKERQRRLLFCWLVLALVAVACFLPWVWFTSRYLGGYLAVEKFHRGFLDFQWLHNLIQQAEMQVFLAGWPSRLAPAACFLGSWIVLPKTKALRVPLIASVVFLLLALGAFTAELGACVALALLGAPDLWCKAQSLGRLLLSTLAAFFVLVPCYTPYARLALPFSLLAAIAAGPAVARVFSFASVKDAGGHGTNNTRRRTAAFLALGIVAAALSLWGARVPGPWFWKSHAGGREAVATLMGFIPKSSVLFVDAAPEAAFYFQQARLATFCMNSLAYRGSGPYPFTYQSAAPVFVVAGLYARQQGDWRIIDRLTPGRLRLVARAAFDPSEVRLLDNFPPSEAAAYRLHPDGQYDLFLYRVFPQAGGLVSPAAPR